LLNNFENDPLAAMVYAIERMRDAGKKLFGRKMDDGESVLRVANSYLMSLDSDPEKIDARAIVLTADEHFCSWKHEGDFPDASEFAREYRKHFKAMYEWRQLPGVDAHGSPLCIRVDSSLPESEKQKIVAQSALEIGMSVPQKQLPRPPEERELDRELIRLGSKFTGGTLEEKRAEIARLEAEKAAQIAALKAEVGGGTQ
jgi:hypothetical protein